MRFDGTLSSWNEARGFGFIAPSKGGQEVFVHVRAIPTQYRPPRIGQAFTFEVETDAQGRKRATNLGVAGIERADRRRPAGRPAAHARGARWNTASLFAIPAFMAVYLAVAAAWRVSGWVALAYLAMSVVCFLAYAADKAAATAGRWRSSEQSLLLLGLAGGWPGAAIAQQVLRHKSRKASFRAAFRMTVLLNVGGFVLLHSPLVTRLLP
jgi:uncharacterized membrane protein YsdA (DUF1294 family)/cold shock CspA family protein